MFEKKNIKFSASTLLIVIAVFISVGLALGYFSDYMSFTNLVTAGEIDITVSDLLTEEDPDGDDDDLVSNPIENLVAGDVTTIEWTVENVGNKSAYTRNVLYIAWDSVDDLSEAQSLYIYPANMSDDEIRNDIANNTASHQIPYGGDNFIIDTGNVTTNGIALVFLGDILDGSGNGAETGDATESNSEAPFYLNNETIGNKDIIRFKLAFAYNALREYENQKIYTKLQVDAIQYRNNTITSAYDEQWPPIALTGERLYPIIDDVTYELVSANKNKYDVKVSNTAIVGGRYKAADGNWKYFNGHVFTGPSGSDLIIQVNTTSNAWSDEYTFVAEEWQVDFSEKKRNNDMFITSNNKHITMHGDSEIRAYRAQNDNGIFFNHEGVTRVFVPYENMPQEFTYSATFMVTMDDADNSSRDVMSKFYSEGNPFTSFSMEINMSFTGYNIGVIQSGSYATVPISDSKINIMNKKHTMSVAVGLSSYTIYYDGVAVSTKPRTDLIRYVVSPLQIGGYNGWRATNATLAKQESFDGTISNVKVYERVITAEEAYLLATDPAKVSKSKLMIDYKTPDGLLFSSFPYETYATMPYEETKQEFSYTTWITPIGPGSSANDSAGRNSTRAVSYRDIFNKSYTTNLSSFSLAIGSSTAYTPNYLYVGVDDKGQKRYKLDKQITEGKKYNVTILYKKNFIEGYIDGELVGTFARTGNMRYDNAKDLIFGGDKSSGNVETKNYNGFVHYFKMYDRVLTDSEIKKIYNNGY